MTDDPQAPALEPLWSMALGAAAGAGFAMAAPAAETAWSHLSIIVIGGVCLLVAGRFGRKAPLALWFAAGLFLAGGHGLHQSTGRHDLLRLTEMENPLWVRARLVVTDGWTHGRWGWRTRVKVLDARHPSETVPELRRCRLEIRSVRQPGDLPRPGSVVQGLVSIRGSPRSPLLVATSPRLVEATGSKRALPAIRDRFAHYLLIAAGTDVRRIRAAELAATLSLGRRDLIPGSRRDGWRRSGLAHVLAVSGLHVGLVAGMTWLILAAAGASPTVSRVVVLVILPGYALLTGGSPSAVRAALMGVIYICARLLGRALVPMAAVLFAAVLLLVSDPSLINEASFQLTVLLTAALVRWTPRLSAAIPLPRWFSAAIAIPVIAQLAAAPLVAIHFTTAVPGAVLANILVPWLLGPLVLSAVSATATAPLSSNIAAALLDLTDLNSRLLWHAGAPGRLAELVPPPIPLGLLIALVGLGLLSLLPGRRAGTSSLLYVVCLSAAAILWLVIPPADRTEIELLPVSHGLSIRVGASGTHLLMDGGGLQREAAEMLAASRVRRLDAVIASHSDEDHIGGLETILSTTRVNTLVIPRWLRQSREAAPLLRTARRRGVRVLPVTRGSRVTLGAADLEVLWPPASDPPQRENERSLVARLRLADRTVLLTADIGHTTERRLAASTDLGCSIVIVPHHGSRGSASEAFLDATGPVFALIPAGPENLHHHPHREVLDRLGARGIGFRMPIRDGRCGARWRNGGWVLVPEE